jgi:hypothetical protein
MRTALTKIAVTVTAFLLAITTLSVASATTSVANAATRCSDTTPPSWFYDIATNAAQSDSNIPDSWGTSINLARIVCFESSYQTGAVNGSYYGLGQMSKTNVLAANVTWDHYLNGSSAHHIAFYQLLAAMRYCKSRYGDPATGWAHEVNYGWW